MRDSATLKKHEQQESLEQRFHSKFLTFHWCSNRTHAFLYNDLEGTGLKHQEITQWLD